MTKTAIRGYMDFLQHAGWAPRTRSWLCRFCRWAMDEGYLRRNPARLMERPTVVAMAPTELSPKQRFVLKQLVELHASLHFTAIFALGYWAGLRISEIAALRVDQCLVNQRAGSITLLDAKGGKTRRSICTIWLAGRCTTISFQHAHKTASAMRKVSMSSRASGRPDCTNRDWA